MRLTFHKPMLHPTLGLAQKIDTSFVGQQPKVANQIRDGVLINGATGALKNREGLSRRANMLGPIHHVSPDHKVASQRARATLNCRTRDGVDGAIKKADAASASAFLPPQTLAVATVEPVIEIRSCAGRRNGA